MSNYPNPPPYTRPTASSYIPSPQMYGRADERDVPMFVPSYSGPAGQNPHVMKLPVSGCPIQVYNQVPAVYGSFQSRHARYLGSTQIVLGLFCIVVNAVAIAFEALFSFASIGIWGGILFIITGGFGISAAKQQSRCKIIAFMVLSIVSVNIAIVLAILSLKGALLQGYYGHYCHRSYFGESFSCQYIDIVTNALLAILGFAECAAGIYGYVLCRMVIGYCNSFRNNQIVVVEQQSTASRYHPSFITPESQLRFTRQAQSSDAGGYQTQQRSDEPAPPYTSSSVMDTAPLLIQESDATTNKTVEINLN